MTLRRPTAVLATAALALGLVVGPQVSPATAAPPASAPVPQQLADGPGNPVLEWEPVAGATGYRVEVATASSFATKLWTTSTFGLHATPPNDLPTGRVYWRVAAVNGSEVGPWEISSFVKEASAGPDLVSPGHEDTLAYPADAPVLRWSVLTGVKGYEVELDDADDFVGATVFSTANTSLALTDPLTLEKPYYWRVRGVSAVNGVTTAWSSARSFTVEWGAAVGRPTLEDVPMTAGDRGMEVQDVLLRWSPVAGARAYELEVSPNGDWANNVIDRQTVMGTQYSRAITYPAGGYYWRVRAVATAPAAMKQYGPWSEPKQFTRAWTNKPEPTSPIGGTVTRESFRLTWTPVPHASSYEVHIGTDPNFGTSATTVCRTLHTTLAPHTISSRPRPSTTVGADCEFEPNPGTVYHWRVRGLDTAPTGTTSVLGVWSTTARFTFDQSAVRMDSPRFGEQVSAPVLRWQPLAGYHRYQVVLMKDGSTTRVTADTDSTSWSPTDGEGGKIAPGTYQWYVLGVSAGGALTPVPGAFGRFELVAPTAPGPSITGMAANNFGQAGDMPSLTWSPVADATYYRVYHASSDTNVYQELTAGDDELPQAAYTHPSQLPAGTWKWYVRAFDKNDVAIADSPVSTFTVAPVTLVTPTGPAQGSRNADVPTLTWGGARDAFFYRVHLATDPYFTNVVRTYDTHFPSLTPREALPDNSADQSYYWYAQVCRSRTVCGPGPQAAFESEPAKVGFFQKISPAVAQPANPDEVTPVAFGDQVSLAWGDYVVKNPSTTPPPGDGPAPGAQAYRVEVASDPGFSKVVDSAVVDQPFYAPWSTTYPDSVYYWRVQAIDEARQALTSSPTWTFQKSSSAPATTDTNVVSGMPTLTWSATAAAGSYYVEVFRGTDPNFPAANRVTTGTTYYPAFTPKDALPVGDYSWRVRKADVKNNPGTWTSGTNFVVPAKTPALLNPRDEVELTSDDVVLRWSSLQGASSYRVDVSTSSSFASVHETATTVNNAWAVTKYLSDGTRYFWRVAALDSKGQVIGTSATRSLTKNQVSVDLTSSANPAASKQSVTFTATVSRPSKAPAGTVEFHDGETKLGQATMKSGVATFTTSTLAVGTHAVVATWVGDSTSARTSSGTLEQTITPAGASYTPVSPYRAMSFQEIGSGRSHVLRLTNVPKGATAVALNVTAANPTANTYVSVCPGDTRVDDCKTSSNLNPYAGRSTANMVVAKLGPNNEVLFYNNLGTVQMIADVQGWFTEGTATGARYVSVPPHRAMSFQPMDTKQMHTLTLRDVPKGATAVALNVTAANPAANTYVSVCPGGTTMLTCSSSSSLNPYAGNSTPNAVVVKLGAGNTVQFYNNIGQVHLIADVQGWFVEGAAEGSGYVPNSPTRVMAFQKVAGGKTYTLTLPDVPAGATAVALNLTSANHDRNTYVSACPGGTPVGDCKTSSNLNPYAERAVAGMVMVKIGPRNTVTFYNDQGTAQLIADVQGWFVE
ncbi:Ig-like domain repeat protein [Cellulomonas sp. 179-A 9B4 NHS]|uniref:Ig-like domain repeat protein n=1 Tax=Cellulomonas sp. 179-A 9B4 NHS TaxID=3142379 RepID=UPI0039A05615